VAPSSLLAKFPPTHIAAGGLDPLLDDGVHFAHRLLKVQRPVTTLFSFFLRHTACSLDVAMASQPME
jgi:acetyl esterase/lipase